MSWCYGVFCVFSRLECEAFCFFIHDSLSKNKTTCIFYFYEMYVPVFGYGFHMRSVLKTNIIRFHYLRLRYRFQIQQVSGIDIALTLCVSQDCMFLSICICRFGVAQYETAIQFNDPTTCHLRAWQVVRFFWFIVFVAIWTT